MKKELRDFGLTDNEIQVYLALVELGESTATPLRQKTELHTSRIYEALTSLTKKTDDRKDTKSTGEKLELIGVIAEMCFAKIFDLPLILTNGIDAGSDFTITDKTIDCKGTDCHCEKGRCPCRSSRRNRQRQ